MSMSTKLHYSMKDPATGEVRPFTPDELRDVIAQSTKPVLVVTLGRDVFRGEHEMAKIIRCASSFYPKDMAENMHIIAVHSDERMTDTKLSNLMHQYRDGTDKVAPTDEFGYDLPANFGQQLLHDLITPHMPYAGYVNEETYGTLLEQARLKASQFNFLGHSFGAVVHAQMADAMPDMLESHGFHPADTNAIIGSMARLNIGNPYNVTDENSKLPGVDYNHGFDQICADYHNIPHEDASSTIRMGWKGNSLQFCPMQGDAAVDVATLSPTEAATDEERKSMTSSLKLKAQRGDKPSPWTIERSDISDTRRHALQLYLFNNLLQLDPSKHVARQTSQAFPGGEVINDYMQAMITSSQHAVQTEKPRAARALAEAVEEQYQSPQAREALVANWQKNKDRFNASFDRT